MQQGTGVVLLLCAVAALAGCGDEARPTAGVPPGLSGTTSVAQPLPAASELPALSADRKDAPDCRRTWRAGLTLPQHYDGCVDDALEVVVVPKGHECADGSRLVSFRGRQWAVTGGPISLTRGAQLLDDDAYLAALESCQPA